MKRCKNKKRKTKKFGKLHLEETKELFLIFSVLGMDKRAFSKEIYWLLSLKLHLLQYLFFLQYFHLNWENVQISQSCFGRAISLLHGKEVGMEGKGTDYTTLRFKIWLKTKWKKLTLKNIHKLDKTLLNSWNMSERTIWYHTK